MSTTCSVAEMQQARIDAAGNYADRPDYTINASALAGYRLTLEVTSNCDMRLLVNTADGVWHFDDDSGMNNNALLSLRGQSDGKIDVWIGTYSTDLCSAQLRVQAID